MNTNDNTNCNANGNTKFSQLRLPRLDFERSESRSSCKCPRCRLSPSVLEAVLCAIAINDPESYYNSGCKITGLTYRELHASLLREV